MRKVRPEGQVWDEEMLYQAEVFFMQAQRPVFGLQHLQ